MNYIKLGDIVTLTAFEDDFNYHPTPHKINFPSLISSIFPEL
jgi:hypothetical protein